jgi:hypothetical protein
VLRRRENYPFPSRLDSWRFPIPLIISLKRTDKELEQPAVNCQIAVVADKFYYVIHWNIGFYAPIENFITPVTGVKSKKHESGGCFVYIP